MRSGAPSTVIEATEPANMPISNPRSSAMRAEIGSKTEPGWTHASPARTARMRARRSLQFIGSEPRDDVGTGLRLAALDLLHRRRQRRVGRRGNADLLALGRDEAVDEVDLGAPA